MNVGLEKFGVNYVFFMEPPLEAIDVFFVVLFGGEENFVGVDELLCSFIPVCFEVSNIRS